MRKRISRWSWRAASPADREPGRFSRPGEGRKATAAAAVAGLGPATGVEALRVEGTDRPGLGAKMTTAIAEAGINLRGISAAVLGSRFVAYMAFDSAEDAEKRRRRSRPLAAAKGPRKKS